jgi:hypothetical protein
MSRPDASPTSGRSIARTSAFSESRGMRMVASMDTTMSPVTWAPDAFSPAAFPRRSGMRSNRTRGSPCPATSASVPSVEASDTTSTSMRSAG